MVLGAIDSTKLVVNSSQYSLLFLVNNSDFTVRLIKHDASDQPTLISLTLSNI